MDSPTIRFFYNLGHEYIRFMNYRFPPKAVTAMLQGLLNDSFQARPNRYGGCYENFDVGDFANDFNNRCSTFTNQIPVSVINLFEISSSEFLKNARRVLFFYPPKKSRPENSISDPLQ